MLLSIDSEMEMTFSSSTGERSLIVGGLGEHPTGNMFTSAIGKLRANLSKRFSPYTYLQS